MSLTSELVLGFLQYLIKADLKTSRLVCKLWSGCASECLFNKLFISPHQLNLQTFVAIAHEPQLEKCVRELEYDGIHFSPDVTMSEYFENLWNQTQMVQMVPSAKECPFTRAELEVNHYVALRKQCPQHNPRLFRESMVEAEIQCCGFTFVQEGYRRWMQEAHFQKACTERNVHIATLVCGLRELTGLRTVKLREEWPSRHKLGRREPGHEGSPLARSWHPLHAFPERLNLDPEMPLNPSKAITDFRTLTFALSESGKTAVRNLSIESTMPPTTFIYKPDVAQIHVDDGIAAYQRLERLKIRLAAWCDRPSDEFRDNLVGLQRVLESMTALKQFELDLPDNYLAIYIPYTVIFPKNGYWPQLHTFKVKNLAIGTRDLINLLAMKMPSLLHLAFGNVQLLDGRWEGMVEFLKVSNRLSSLDLHPKSLLFQHGNRMYLLPYQPGWPGIFHARILCDPTNNNLSIGDYVMNGRKDSSLKHPSLSSDQPAHQAIGYLDDVLRLCTMNGTDDTLKGPIKVIMDEYARHSRAMEEI